MRAWVGALLGALLWLPLYPGNVAAKEKPAGKGTVHIVLCIDTEPLGNLGSGRKLEIDLTNFRDGSPRSHVYNALKSGWRDRFLDSFGGHPKLTWYVLTSQLVSEASTPCAIYDELIPYREDIDRLGDEIAWHYHHTDWIHCLAANKDSLSWSQLKTFDGTRYDSGTDIEICEDGLNHLLAEHEFFPVSFRSGWVWENTDFSNWLENVVPFDLSSTPPFKNTTESDGICRSNESDWSRATLEWIPFHPDSTDYQRPGNMNRLLSRTCLHRFNDKDLKTIAAAADSGSDQLVSIALHSYSNISFSLSNTLDQITAFFEQNGIPYRFSTSREAFVALTKTERTGKLALNFRRKGDDILLSAEGNCFQRFPYVVLVDGAGQLSRIYPQADGKNRWRIPAAQQGGSRLYAAISSVDGRSCVAKFSLDSTGDPEVVLRRHGPKRQ